MRESTAAPDAQLSVAFVVPGSGPLNAAGFSGDGPIGERMMNGSHVNDSPFVWLGLGQAVVRRPSPNYNM